MSILLNVLRKANDNIVYAVNNPVIFYPLYKWCEMNSVMVSTYGVDDYHVATRFKLTSGECIKFVLDDESHQFYSVELI